MDMDVQLPVRELSGTSFASFGSTIAMPRGPADADGPGWHWWSETALLPTDSSPYGIGYLNLQPAALRFDWAEQHLRSAEMIIPVGGDCLVYVGLPPDPEGRAFPGPEHFQVFRVRVGQAVILRPRIWHGAPLALGTPLDVMVLLRQHTSRDDATVVRFPETPVTIVP